MILDLYLLPADREHPVCNLREPKRAKDVFKLN